MFSTLKRSVSTPNRVHASTPESEASVESYHAVSVYYARGHACPAIKKLAGKRFLSKEAPLLPLKACTTVECRCRYQHYEDRRDEPRREADSGPTANVPVGDEQRGASHGRRVDDFDGPRTNASGIPDYYEFAGHNSEKT